MLRLRALPELHDLGRRSGPYRLQLERTLAEVMSARTRLADGSYGQCTACSAPISLAVLTEKPWSPTCIHCALDI
jgi:RNA polymerase-binding transcription factor DksA